MYTRSDRERILADLRASGMTMAAFGRIPGNPSRATLRAWSRQAERGELDVPVRDVRGRAERPGRHARYAEETKDEARRLAAKGMRPCDIARRLNVSSGSVVRGWLRAGPGPGRAAAADRGAAEEIARLAAELEESRMRERALLELMRDPKAGDPASLSSRQRAELGERLRRAYGYSQRQVATFFGMPRSTYASATASSRRAEARRAEVAAAVRRAFEEGGRTYGYRRVRALMASWAEPFRASEREVRRAMREGGMAPRSARARRAWSSYEGEPDERPANLPLRADGTHDFSAPAPDALVVTDVTEVGVGGGKAYVSPVVDCFDGLPAAWSVSRHPDSGLCDSSLARYAAGLPDGHGPVAVHTDGGGPYRAGSWKELCARHGFVRSMSRKGRSPDNARAEGFFGTLKAEFYNGRDWDGCTYERFVEELDGYMEWYREGRLKAFRGPGGTVEYETIMGRRRRLGYAK